MKEPKIDFLLAGLNVGQSELERVSIAALTDYMIDW